MRKPVLYGTSKAALMVGVVPQMISKWERRGLLPFDPYEHAISPRTGHRRFTPENIEQLKQLKIEQQESKRRARAKAVALGLLNKARARKKWKPVPEGFKGKLYTLADAAALVGVGIGALHEWERLGLFAFTPYGIKSTKKVRVPHRLYSSAHVKALKAIAKRRKKSQAIGRARGLARFKRNCKRRRKS